MSDVQQPIARLDDDIREDVQAVIVRYPPTNSDRHQIFYDIDHGTVRLRGHVKTPINRSYLAESLPRIKGVKQVDTSALFDDESLRLKAGTLLPRGVMVNVTYGVAVLSGSLPDEISEESLVEKVAAIPGISKILVRI
jgi:osmotically-inducible protein OsmY